jgi:hypothetical protein
MRKRFTLAVIAVILGLLCTGAAPSAALEMTEPADVAPRVDGTRYQMQPVAAWSESAGCWLVAWREGSINDGETDVWCARVAADGTPLDPDGIRLTSIQDRQEYPRVACDGSGFLVAWEDLRSGKDYDVYAARVGGQGNVSDENGFLVAGGEHSQCRPAVAFAAEHYWVVWQAFRHTPGSVAGDAKGSGYCLHARRVSTQGKLADAEAVELAQAGQQGMGNYALPAAAAGDDRVLVACVGSSWNDRREAFLCFFELDAQTGQLLSGPSAVGPSEGHGQPGRRVGTHYAPALCCSGQTVLAAVGAERFGSVNLWNTDASGRAAREPAVLEGNNRVGLAPLYSLTVSGSRCLFVVDRAEVPRDANTPHTWVAGALFATGGPPDLSDRAITPVAQAEHACMQPFACAGPEGTWLVAYVALNGPDDMKVQARLVKEAR